MGSLKEKLKMAVHKMKFSLNFNVNIWKVESSIVASSSKRWLSFNDRDGFKAACIEDSGSGEGSGSSSKRCMSFNDRSSSKRWLSFNDMEGLKAACFEDSGSDEGYGSSRCMSFSDRDGLKAVCVEDSGSDEGSGSGWSRRQQSTTSYPSEDDDIDKRAEAFIAKFHKHLQLERQISLQLKYSSTT